MLYFFMVAYESIIELPVLKGVTVNAQDPAVVYFEEYEGFWI